METSIPCIYLATVYRMDLGGVGVPREGGRGPRKSKILKISKNTQNWSQVAKIAKRKVENFGRPPLRGVGAAPEGGRGHYLGKFSIFDLPKGLCIGQYLCIFADFHVLWSFSHIYT